uniref:Integral membrane protein n=1 Tax=Streptomyces sp. NBC_00049 TaxID=2903617 RepID=A0AAU2K4S9_9ACTN
MPAQAAAEQAYLPPYPGTGRHAAAPEPAAYPGPEAQAPAEETAYLPPYPGPEEQRSAVPDGLFRDEVQAPAPDQDWSRAAETAYLPPYPGPEQQPEAAAEQTAYLPPQAAPAEPAPVLVPVPEEAAGEEPAWSPPTLAGNTLRAVDPAQARAEGRSPIIDPGPQSAILTAALGLLLAVAAAAGQYALLVPLVALQGLTAAGWFRLNGMWPARQGIALAFAGALVADAAVLAVDRTYGPGAIIGTLGAWVLLTLVLQLRSHADPDERMYGLMASVASAALAIVCAGYLAADTAAVTVGAAAVAVAVFARALPLPTAPSVGVSLAAAAGAGIAVGGLTSVGVGGALIGLVAGACALVGLRVAAYDYPSKFVHMTAGVALPLAAAAPAVYLIGRVVS